jgi:hypothetical protein
MHDDRTPLDLTGQPEGVRRLALDYRPGHQLHDIHARHLGLRPWGWRPGVLHRVDGQEAVVHYLLEDGTVSVWHEDGLQDLVDGTPVRVHEELRGLDAEGLLLHVQVTGGLGPVPAPADPGLWQAEMRPFPVVDVARGAAVLDVPHEPGDC